MFAFKKYNAINNRYLVFTFWHKNCFITFQPIESQNSKTNSENGDNDSLWKGVRNFATMFMEEGLEEGATSEPVAIDGIDYNLGKIQLALSYDFQSLTLTLKILQAQQLPAKDFTGTSDPYVKILLLPDKKHKLLTKVKKKNLNPRWNECFLFEGESFLIYITTCYFFNILLNSVHIVFRSFV